MLRRSCERRRALPGLTNIRGGIVDPPVPSSPRDAGNPAPPQRRKITANLLDSLQKPVDFLKVLV